MRAILTTLLLAFVVAAPAAAQITNGSFDSLLSGWTTSVTGNGYAIPNAFGNPANSARLTAVTTIFGGPSGSATIQQTFQCGAGGGSGSCVVSWDYIAFTEEPAVSVMAWIDGTPVYSAMHTSGQRSEWTRITRMAGCGEHTLIITAVVSTVTSDAPWNVYVDNVTAGCESPVPVEGRTWGGIKALYR